MVKKIMTLAMALSFASLLAVVPSALAKNGADDVVPQPEKIQQENVG